ncbi:MAG: tetratricopeptide repeat protein [Lacibacter sp.]
MTKRLRLIPLFFLFCLSVAAQPDFVLPLEKPEKYKSKVLVSEKSDEKKFTLPRRLSQGLFTHYNYYYNAHTKLNTVLQKAKLAHQDNYTELLPFYNFSTAVTAADSLELDSVIYKATAGIVLHDLRNSYIDNLYLLIGKSFFYWQKFDSAYRIFQFINYNFYPKAKDEYFIVVGSNTTATNGTLNFGTKENKGLIQKAFSKAPSRNDALLWLAKTYAADSLLAEAYSLVNLLRRDPLFPKRLYSHLDETQAYVFYRQQMWDSSAYYLEKALVNATDKSEQARWEYLIAQMYSRVRKNDLASIYYNKAKKHTADPVLYIHARIYEAQLVKSGGTNSLRTTLEDLKTLSKKERFDGFESILYYAASDIALQIPDTAEARILLNKSIQFSSENVALRNKSFIKLAELAYHQRDYELAASGYDSIDYQDPYLGAESVQLQARQQILKELIRNIKLVHKEDSLQRIAAMPEKEREAYIKALVRKLRKQRGLKEEEANYVPVLNPNQSSELFTTNATADKWYFNNPGQRSKGAAEFNAKWGKRPNVDQWRRQAVIDATMQQNNDPFAMSNDPDHPAPQQVTPPVTNENTELSVEGLTGQLPLTAEQLEQSNKNIREALLTQGQIYKNQIEDYEMAIRTFEELLKRFPVSDLDEEVLFELFYCYSKTGNTSKSAYYRSQLNQKYPEGNLIQKTKPSGKTIPAKDTATVVYANIYDLFIQGRFTEAVHEKRKADSVYQNSYWTPQLLYIEALYYIRQRNDSLALQTLTNLETQFSGTPMAEKAAVMKDVLSRRDEIETYLTNTTIVRRQEDSIRITAPVVQQPVVPTVQVPVVRDTIVSKPPVDLPKVGQKIEKKTTRPEKNAIVKKAKPPVAVTPNIVAQTKPVTDTVKTQPAVPTPIENNAVYKPEPDQPHYVLIWFDQVDPIYVSESRNAFHRYNSSNHSNMSLQAEVFEESPQFIGVEIGILPNSTATFAYLEELKQNAQQIIPWLTPDKYKFLFVSQKNWATLKSRKNLEEYQQFLKEHYKDKF